MIEQILLWLCIYWVLDKLYTNYKNREKMKTINFYANQIEKKILLVNLEEINNVLYAYHHANSKFMSQGKTVNDIVTNLVKMNSDLEFIVVVSGPNIETIYDKTGKKIQKIVM